MASILRSFALLSLVLPILSTPVANDVLARGIFERVTCADNLGRCFRPTGTASKDIASRAAATAFCSSFLSVPVVTSVIATSTPVASITVTNIVTASTETQTSVLTSDIEEIVTLPITVTITVPFPATRVIPRALATKAPLPNCASAALPEKFASACACISVIPSTTYVIAIAPTSTNTALETLSVTITATTLTTTTEITGTKTVTVTATATETTAPECTDLASPYTSNGKTWRTTCNKYSANGKLILDVGGKDWNYRTFPECIDKCSSLSNCIYGFWVSYTSPIAQREGGNCYLYYQTFPTTEGPLAGVSAFYPVAI